jgi:tetratricopeptide (TPR) repeat protein
MGMENLPIESDWKVSVRELVKNSDAFCFVISADFEKSAACLAELTEVRRQRPAAPRFLVLVNITESRCVEAEIPILLKQDLGGVARRDVSALAGRVDAAGRRLPPPVPELKFRREVAVSPDPLTSLLSQGDLRLRRRESEAGLISRLGSSRVLAISGTPSSGRSALALDALAHLDEHEPDRLRRPLFIVATRECGGSVPDLQRLCTALFEAVGPPPATAADEPAAALTALLDDCEVWLLLDGFETVSTEDGRCRDPELARFLRIADENLERGRVILTAATPGIIMEGERRCAHFVLPEWKEDELARLAEHISGILGARSPDQATLAQLQRWASGNPYLLVLAVREWCATGSPPQISRGQARPLQALGRFIGTISGARTTILQILSLVATFPVSGRLVERVVTRASRELPSLRGDAMHTVADDLRALVAAGLVQPHPGENGTLYQLPGLVTAHFRDAQVLEPNLYRALGRSAAACILQERDGDDASLNLAGAAVYDGATWLWPELRVGEVSRAVRAADVLVNAGSAGRAVAVLTGGADILKRFNRFAPASVRRRFFDRISATAGLSPTSRHEALRGLALALADAAEFTAAIAALDDAVKALSQSRRRVAGSRTRLLEAKNLDLRAYCLRQLNQVDQSIASYEKAIQLLGDGGDADERCKLLRGLANSFIAKRDWKQARTWFDEARNISAILQTDRKRFNIGRIDCDFAILAMLSGSLEEAEVACNAGIEAMRACGDLWNQRIAVLNQCGVDLARNGDIARQRDAVQSTIPLLVQLESVVALRAARKNIDQLAADALAESVRDWWTFVELT